MKKWHIACLLAALIGTGSVVAVFFLKQSVQAFYPMMDHNRIANLASMLSQVTTEDMTKASVPLSEEPINVTEKQVRIILESLRARNAVPELPVHFDLLDYKGETYQVSFRRPKVSDGRWISSNGRSGPNEFVVSVYSSAIDSFVER